MKTLHVDPNPAIRLHLAVVVTDDLITVRTLGLSPVPAEALDPSLELYGDNLWNYLGGLGQERISPYNPFDIDLGVASPKAWAHASALAMGDSGIVIERDAVTILRSPEVLGRWAASDGMALVFMAGPEGRITVNNRTLMTLDGRVSERFAMMRERKVPLVTLVTPYADTRWTDAHLIVRQSAGCQLWLTHGGKGIERFDHVLRPGPREYVDPTPYEGQPVMRATGSPTVSQGASVSVGVSVIGPGGQPDPACNSVVYLETVAGYVPNTRLQLNGGTGTFTVHPTGLEVGEAVRVKVGWRDLPGLAEYSAEVVQ